MSSHHRISSWLNDDNHKNMFSNRSRVNKVTQSHSNVFGGNKFHSSYANWNSKNDPLRTSVASGRFKE